MSHTIYRLMNPKMWLVLSLISTGCGESSIITPRGDMSVAADSQISEELFLHLHQENLQRLPTDLLGRIEEFLRLLNSGNASDAWGLVSEERKRTLGYGAFSVSAKNYAGYDFTFYLLNVTLSADREGSEARVKGATIVLCTIVKLRPGTTRHSFSSMTWTLNGDRWECERL